LRLKKRFSFGAAQTVTAIIAIQLILSAVVILNFYTTPVITIISTFSLALFFSLLGVFLAHVDMQQRKTDQKKE
jgi:hypothetical protein